MQDEKATEGFVETMTGEYGTSARTFKTALIFCVPESPDALREDTRKVLAWEAIQDDDLKLDESQLHQLGESLKKARRDLKETIWRTYKNLMLLGKDNVLKNVDLGLIHSSAATDLLSLILSRLRSDGDLEHNISPSFLVRNWPPAFKEWSTKSVRDAFFASPLFPRLTNPDALKETISRGVGNGQLGYVGKTASNDYKPFWFSQPLTSADVELSDEMFIITKETADAYLITRAKPLPPGTEQPPLVPPRIDDPEVDIDPLPSTAFGLTWNGDIPPLKWVNFYMKVLPKFVSVSGLNLRVKVEFQPKVMSPSRRSMK